MDDVTKITISGGLTLVAMIPAAFLAGCITGSITILPAIWRSWIKTVNGVWAEMGV